MVRRLATVGLLTAAVYAATGSSPQSSTTGMFGNGDVALSYTLTRPTRHPPFPAVVIGQGSGPVRKHECKFLAEGFVRRGYATLCYDKRGVGLSSGTYEVVTTENSERVFARLAGDLAAGVAFLAKQRDIDARRIGLAGGSQAGWIVPLAALRAFPPPAFMVLLSAPTVTVGEEIYFSRTAERTTAPIAQAYASLDGFSGPRGFDPVPALRALDIPGLWLLGQDDRSIPIRDTIRVLDDLIDAGRPYRAVTFPGAGHGLQGADIWAAIDAFLPRTD
jgi:pimeloyl-ACP methyl ester carboxylesterase